MDQVLKLRASYVVKLIGGYHLDIRHQKRRLEPCPCDPLIDARVCYADLVDQVSVGRDNRMIGFASQHIDCSRRLIIWCVLVGEQRPRNRIGDSPARFVLVQRPLKRAHEHVALGAVNRGSYLPWRGNASPIRFSTLGGTMLSKLNDIWRCTQNTSARDLKFWVPNIRSASTSRP
jgi:hypothetical protein